MFVLVSLLLVSALLRLLSLPELRGDQRVNHIPDPAQPKLNFCKDSHVPIRVIFLFHLHLDVVVVVGVVWVRSGEASTYFNALVDENKPI